MGNKAEEPPKSVGVSKDQYERLVTKVFDYATFKAKQLKAGDTFTVALSPDEIPEGAHYGYITGAIAFRAERHGLNAGLADKWTFTFTKL